MHTKLVRIGNSQGVRLSRTVIEQAQLTEDLDIEVRGHAVIIRPVTAVREGWGDAAAACHAEHADDLDDWDTTTSDAGGEWQ